MSLSRGRKKPANFSQCRQTASRKTCRKQFGRSGFGNILRPFDFVIDTQIDAFDALGKKIGLGKVGTKIFEAEKALVKAPITIPVAVSKAVLNRKNLIQAGFVLADIVGLGLIATGALVGSTGIGGVPGTAIAAGGASIIAAVKTGEEALRLARQVAQVDRAIITVKKEVEGKGDEAPKVGVSQFATERRKAIKELEDLRKKLEQKEKKKEEKLSKDELTNLEKELKSILEEDLKNDKKPKGDGKGGAPIVSNIGDKKLAMDRLKSKFQVDEIADQGLENTSQREEPKPSAKAPVDTVGLVVEEDDFKFSDVSNETIINKTSRRKLDAAFKTDLLDKPKNFNNAKKLAGTGSGTQKQKAATLEKNSDNIYNQIIREITNADDCRIYLTENSAKIAILPLNLKQELRDYCESIMADDN